MPETYTMLAHELSPYSVRAAITSREMRAIFTVLMAWHLSMLMSDVDIADVLSAMPLSVRATLFGSPSAISHGFRIYAQAHNYVSY
jgi:hypothetical protein